MLDVWPSSKNVAQTQRLLVLVLVVLGGTGWALGSFVRGADELRSARFGARVAALEGPSMRLAELVDARPVAVLATEPGAGLERAAACGGSARAGDSASPSAAGEDSQAAGAGVGPRTPAGSKIGKAASRRASEVESDPSAELRSAAEREALGTVEAGADSPAVVAAVRAPNARRGACLAIRFKLSCGEPSSKTEREVANDPRARDRGGASFPTWASGSESPGS